MATTWRRDAAAADEGEAKMILTHIRAFPLRSGAFSDVGEMEYAERQAPYLTLDVRLAIGDAMRRINP